ncbi:MAG: tetratricopeptide repeat protein [Gammaproteobacteria bacterium]|nr:tetratricopeptide repeat protein [Gammaproteobacteria bacterium]
MSKSCRPGVTMVFLTLLVPPWGKADEAQRKAAHETVRAHLEAEQYDEALEVAEGAVRRTEQEVGTEASELVAPLLDLAKVQGIAGEYATSANHYERAISLIEAADGPYDRRLIEPLSGLGEMHLAQQRYSDAVESFQRARHIWHRVDGINTLHQLEVVDGLADSFLGARKLLEANRAKIRAFRIAEHHYGRASLEMAPAIRELADWYLETGQHPGAVILYERALGVLERELGEYDPQLVPVLNGLATARAANGHRLGEAEEALERVLSIIERQPDAGIAERVNALVNLGDWFIQANEAQAAQKFYAEAWGLLASDASSADDMEALFGRPVNLRFPPMPSYEPIPPVPFREIDYRELRERYVDVEFTVGADGRVSDVTIVDADAPLEQMFLVRKRLYEAIYRPRVTGGEPVDTGMRLHQVIPAVPSGY